MQFEFNNKIKNLNSSAFKLFKLERERETNTLEFYL